MKVEDEDILKRFRGEGRCEWCHKYVTIRHAAHIFSRGAGRVDIRGNLISLCFQCHFDSHNGKITRADLLAVAAARERTTQDAIRDEVYRLRREPRPL